MSNIGTKYSRENRVLHGLNIKLKSDIDLINCFLFDFRREKYRKLKKVLETVGKAVQTGIKLIHCNDVCTMFAYFQIIHLRILKQLI